MTWHKVFTCATKPLEKIMTIDCHGNFTTLNN
jgi:hypothetical protein